LYTLYTFFFFKDTATTEIYTLSLHDALPISDLLDPAFWQERKERIQAGYVHDVFPYDRSRRFIHQIQTTPASSVSPEVAPVEEPVDVQPLGAKVHDQGRLTGFPSGDAGSGD